MKVSIPLASVLAGVVLACPSPVRSDDAAEIGARRELFIDATLIDTLDGLERKLHHPVPREIAITHDAPWEGAGSGYHTVIQDGELYRLYHRGSALGVKEGRLVTGKQVYCYAESKDGITFEKPNLGLFEHNGSKDNNIVWNGVGVHNFAPFLDTNPNCSPTRDSRPWAALRKRADYSRFNRQMESIGR